MTEMMNESSRQAGSGTGEEGRTVQKYVDILTDAGFKAVFGDQDNKEVLIDFLNVVLPPHRQVQDLEYSTVEIPGFTLENKSVRLDLRCTSQDGTKFIVEMQQSHQHNFFKRCVEYSAKVYDSGSKRGDRHLYDIPPVYFIGILGKEKMFDRSAEVWKDRFVSSYNFREDYTLEFADETICITFVELNRFDKPLEQCESLIDKWCYALKYVGKLQEYPSDLQAKAFERLFRACEIAKFSPEKKIKYEKDMISERDYINIMETARDDGFAAGKQEGLAEGRAEGLAEGEAIGMAKGEKKGRSEGLAEGRLDGIATVARAMLTSGMDISQISSLTGLTEEQISNL